jgi:aldehyde:ferredoxin oxidoreductase
MGLLYATSNIGASHMAGDLAYPEVFGVPAKIDPLTIDNKPALIMRYEDAFTLIDAAGLCVFLSVRYVFDADVNLWPTRLTELMNLTTGADYTPTTIMQAAERVYNLERLFLVKAGFTKADDTLPPRMLEEPLTEGPNAGEVVELDQMLPIFYQLRGWDEQGVPTVDKLKELGLAV